MSATPSCRNVSAYGTGFFGGRYENFERGGAQFYVNVYQGRPLTIRNRNDNTQDLVNLSYFCSSPSGSGEQVFYQINGTGRLGGNRQDAVLFNPDTNSYIYLDTVNDGYGSVNR